MPASTSCGASPFPHFHCRAGNGFSLPVNPTRRCARRSKFRWTASWSRGRDPLTTSRPISRRWQYAVPLLFNEIPIAIENYFTDAERKFYAAVQRQGGYSCQELIAKLNFLPLEFWRYMLAFHLLGIVEFEKGRGPLDLSGEIAALLELNHRLQALRE